MAEYILKQAIIDRLQNLAYDDWNQGVTTSWANAYAECADIISDFLAADAVEVIRCKDCALSEFGDGWVSRWCNYWDDRTEDDGYCSYGRRKDG